MLVVVVVVVIIIITVSGRECGCIIFVSNSIIISSIISNNIKMYSHLFR